jgi:DNA-binding LytR/AlgR family response regulator
MLNAVIIEDEKPALGHLLQLIAGISMPVTVVACLGSVKESIEYFSTAAEPDIIFSDVQLPDGLSFEIFKTTKTRTPVIFITGYNDFIMNAFEYNGIDYLLKPICAEELEKALSKYQMLEKHFAQDKNSLNNLLQYLNTRKRTRLVVRKGLENIALKLQDIVLFYTENKIVYAIDRQGVKYMADDNLTDLELELDTSSFFRANRQYIININYIKGYKAFEKVKLLVDLTVPDIHHHIVVSQETAPEFRKWIYES